MIWNMHAFVHSHTHESLRASSSSILSDVECTEESCCRLCFTSYLSHLTDFIDDSEGISRHVENGSLVLALALLQNA